MTGDFFAHLFGGVAGTFIASFLYLGFEHFIAKALPAVRTRAVATAEIASRSERALRLVASFSGAFVLSGAALFSALVVGSSDLELYKGQQPVVFLEGVLWISAYGFFIVWRPLSLLVKRENVGIAKRSLFASIFELVLTAAAVPLIKRYDPGSLKHPEVIPLVFAGVFMFNPIRWSNGVRHLRRGRRSRRNWVQLPNARDVVIPEPTKKPSSGPRPAGMAPPANWYPAPNNPDYWRYWNGEQWTEHFAPVRTTEEPLVRDAQKPPAAADTMSRTRRTTRQRGGTLEELVAISCPWCYGKKYCAVCDGTGKTKNTLGLKGLKCRKMVEASSSAAKGCGGSGLCRKCAGRGEIGEWRVQLP